MKRAFLLDRHTVNPYFAVELEGEPQGTQMWSFETWEQVDQFFHRMGATQGELASAKEAILNTGSARLVVQRAKAPNSPNRLRRAPGGVPCCAPIADIF